MKILIMCEGPNELAIIKLLLENNKFKFTYDDLVTLTPFHARQLTSSTAVKTALNIYQGKFVIYRIGDTLTDKLQIPREYANRITTVEKYCTKPELEMLLIISEGLEKEFNKVKSTISPKDFAKTHIKCNRKKYNNSTAFYVDYYGDNIETLVSAITKYKQSHRGAHKNGELYLSDLLK